jgi:molybdopterin/thiamine biosynthesis adenylyltransferase
MVMRSKAVLVVGVGGLGCPAALALVGAGIGRLVLVDDDEVEVTNLHRQILFGHGDVGLPKAEVAKRALDARGSGTEIAVRATRFLPHLADELLEGIDVVVEGADNFATKFLVSDACARAKKPVVHGAALRWEGTVLSCGAEGRPCYRCIFEDIPPGLAPNCADAGVMGPVCGVVGALMADAVLHLAAGSASELGRLRSFDGKTLELRERRLRPRRTCVTCGERAERPTLEPSRYRTPEVER